MNYSNACRLQKKIRTWNLPETSNLSIHNLRFRLNKAAAGWQIACKHKLSSFLQDVETVTNTLLKISQNYLHSLLKF